MKIRINPELALRLMTIANHVRGMEFSGFGFAKKEGEDLVIYDAAILNIGSEGYTEIPPELLLPLLERQDAKNMKVWIHRHPMGNGIPGNHNWSGLDSQTIRESPLGGVPELVRWSASIVLTLGGWVGRVDNHLTGKTIHCEVEPQAREAYKIIEEIRSTPKGVLAWGEEEEIAPEMIEFGSVSELYEYADMIADQFTDWECQQLGITHLQMVEFVMAKLRDGEMIVDANDIDYNDVSDFFAREVIPASWRQR